LHGLAYAHGGDALYHLGFGHWGLAQSAIEKALKVCDSIGDPQLTEMALTLKAMQHYFQGDFVESEQDFVQVLQSAKARSNNQHLAWGAYSRAENLLPRGKVRQASRLIAIAKKLLEGQTDLHSELICHGLNAMTQLRLGKRAEARLAAEDAINTARSVLPNNFSSLEGYAGSIEVLLKLNAEGMSNGITGSDRRRLKQAFKLLANYARIFPIGRPRLWYLRALRSYLEGNRDRATKNWLCSLNRASDLNMKYEEYRACEVLSRLGSLAPVELMRIAARAEQLSAEHGYCLSSLGTVARRIA
jgi:tetratricopeptide (TPR) repeat protein